MAPTSFVYPRTIAVKRSPSQTGVGAQPYGALNRAGETIVVSDCAASIQSKNTTNSNTVGLPADGKMSLWLVFIGRAECTRLGLVAGQIRARDWIIDDAGERYHVLNNYWDSLGFAMNCEKAES